MRIDHVAHPCRDPQRTHNFYTQVLGLKIAQTYAGAELMLVYKFPGGGSVAFTSGQDQPATGSEGTNRADWQRRHVGLTVATRAEFNRFLERLRECAIDHLLIDDERIYFADPDGLVLEIEIESAFDENPAAEQIFEQWLAR